MKVYENYIVRSYRKGDEDKLIVLFKEVFGQAITIGQWRWKYLSSEAKVYSKIAESPSGAIIAHAGAMRLRGILQNRVIPIFQIADVMIHPEARGYLGRKNVFDTLMKSLFEDISGEFNEVFCYGFPGKRPYLLGERMGVYKAVEEATEYSTKPRKTRINLYSIKPINWEDDRFDNLWESLSNNFSLSLIRDKKYLQMRYATNPFFTYRVLGCFLFGKLKGWVVTREEEGKVFLIDLFTERKNIRHILRAIENYFFSEKKTAIHVWLPKNWRNIIIDYKERETGVMVTNMVWKLPIKTSFAKDKLYYTMGDADIF